MCLYVRFLFHQLTVYRDGQSHCDTLICESTFWKHRDWFHHQPQFLVLFIRPKVCFSVNNQSFFFFFFNIIIIFLAFLQQFLEAPAGKKIFFLISLFYFLFIFFGKTFYLTYIYTSVFNNRTFMVNISNEFQNIETVSV